VNVNVTLLVSEKLREFYDLSVSVSLLNRFTTDPSLPASRLVVVRLLCDGLAACYYTVEVLTWESVQCRLSSEMCVTRVDHKKTAAAAAAAQ